MNNLEESKKKLIIKFRSALKFIKANNFGHFKFKYRTELTDFSESAQKYWGKIRKSASIILSHLDKIDTSDKFHNDYMKDVVLDSECLKFFNTADSSEGNWDDLEKTLWDSGWNLEPVQLNEKFDCLLCSMADQLSAFAEILSITKSIVQIVA